MENELKNVNVEVQETKSWTEMSDEELEQLSNVVACMYGCQNEPIHTI